ncbi:Uncharacterised protein [Mycobacteroides abscessus subsp. abscessus]|nr:Uncharacterised protein [Mycobacteroides abscessus subsp. abscessus]
MNPGADATNPTTLTTFTTLLIPTRASTAATALSAQIRARALASSGDTSAPTLPAVARLPSTMGSCPEV